MIGRVCFVTPKNPSSIKTLSITYVVQHNERSFVDLLVVGYALVVVDDPLLAREHGIQDDIQSLDVVDELSGDATRPEIIQLCIRNHLHHKCQKKRL